VNFDKELSLSYSVGFFNTVKYYDMGHGFASTLKERRKTTNILSQVVRMYRRGAMDIN
jgi:hypothetical protein